MNWDDYPAGMADERTLLLGYLDLQRDVIVRKIEGLTEEQARWKPAPTANSLLNLVVHLTGVERNWFEAVLAGLEVDRDRDAELAELPPEVTVASGVDAYKGQWKRSNDIVAELSLDDPCRLERRKELSVRWVLMHMLEETARHAGHADITRELIDGSVGS